MLFKKLFIATLSILALAGCSDNDTIHEIVDTEKGDVIVTFAASGANQVTTKADDDVAKTGYVKVHDNYVLTDMVEEYCRMGTVDDKEFVIDHITVLAFDKATGTLVKSAYFNKDKDEEFSEGKNSIFQFGGIVLKEGTYNFVLAGNLSAKDLADDIGKKNYEYYQKEAFIAADKLCDTADETTHLPMVKFLENVTLTAHKVTASATLNVLYEGGVQIPDEQNPTTDLALPDNAKPVYLKRLVARVQLSSIAYDWKQAGAEEFEMKLLGAALVNAAEKTFIGKDNVDGGEGGFLHGSFTDNLTGWYKPVDGDDGSSMVAYEGEIKSYYKKILNEQQSVVLNNDGSVHSFDINGTLKILPISFYTYAKSGVPEDKNSNYELMLVLKCQLNGQGNEPVYYYVPLRDRTESAGKLAAVQANTIYNVSVTLKGDGSDDAGKKKNTVEPEITISTEDWEGYHVIEGDGAPKPVPAQQ